MNTPIHTYRRAPSNVVPIAPTITDIGTWNARELRRHLFEKVGPIQFVRFEEPSRIAPGVIVWRGVLKSGEAVEGELALWAAVLDSDEIVVGVEITMLPTQAERVARRASRTGGRLLTTRRRELDVVYSEGAVLTAQDVRRLVEANLGQTFNLVFRKSLSGTPNTVSWEALDADGEVIVGAVVLHAGVRESQIVSWATIEMNEPVGSSKWKQAASERDVQLESIARMGRALIHRLRENPKMPTREVVSAVVAMVDEAEATITWSADRRSVPTLARGASRNGTGRG